MTIPEFLKRLKATEGPWTLDEAGNIRRHAGEACGICPICAVANQPLHQVSWWSVYRRVGLSHRDALAIVLAADKGNDYDPVLRRRVLAVTVQR